MQVIAEFFVDPLVWPAYLYFAAYGFVWMIAWGLARLFMNQRSIERATTLAWQIAIVTHILGGTFLIIWLGVRDHKRVAEWWHIPFYLVFYILIMVVDVCLLISLSTRNSKKDEASALPQRLATKSRNPKKE